jgi:uncharacterized protein (DUF1330 family)
MTPPDCHDLAAIDSESLAGIVVRLARNKMGLATRQFATTSWPAAARRGLRFLDAHQGDRHGARMALIMEEHMAKDDKCPSVEEARAWYDSPAYQEAAQHRFRGAVYRGLIVEVV